MISRYQAMDNIKLSVFLLALERVGEWAMLDCDGIEKRVKIILSFTRFISEDE